LIENKNDDESPNIITLSPSRLYFDYPKNSHRYSGLNRQRESSADERLLWGNYSTKDAVVSKYDSRISDRSRDLKITETTHTGHQFVGQHLNQASSKDMLVKKETFKTLGSTRAPKNHMYGYDG
jgi:hypothetical protein